MQQNMMNMNNNQNSLNTLVVNGPQPTIQYPNYPPPPNNYPPVNNSGQPIYGDMSYNPQIYNQNGQPMGQPMGGNMQYGQPLNPYAKGF